MSIPLIINGQTYDYPETGNLEWGPDATGWASAVTTGMLQKAGGLFQLLAEADFGTSFGLKSLYYKSRSSNVASAGQIRFARTDVVSWRNNANSADLDLSVDASDNLLFNGNAFSQTITAVSDTDSIDLTLTGTTLSADLLLSADTADSGYVIVSSSIEPDGLKGQVLVSSIGTVGNFISSLTGDATATGPGAAAVTLATVNSNVGTFGSSTSIPTFTVNAKGLITAASGNVVIAPAGTLTGTTLNATVVNSSLTTLGTITSGTWNGTTIAIANGGTGQTTKAPAFDALSPMTTLGDTIYGGASGTGTRLAGNTTSTINIKTQTGNGSVSAAPVWSTLSSIIDSAISSTQGSVLYRNSSAWVALSPGTSGQFLQTQGAGANPQWATSTGSPTVDGAPAFSVTGFGTVTAAKYISVTNGKVYSAMGRFLNGTPTAVTATINLPSGVTIDTTTMGSASVAVGIMSRETNATLNFASASLGPYIVFYDGSTNNQLFVAATASSNALVKMLGNFNFAASEGAHFFFNNLIIT